MNVKNPEKKKISNRLRIVFMGTPEFAVPALKTLVAQRDFFEVVGVFTQPDQPAGRGMQVRASAIKKVALELGLKIFQPEKLSESSALSDLRALNADVGVVVAYGQILKKTCLEIPPMGFFNIHASLLPRWRGASPIHHALLKGDQKSGVTIIKINEKLDAGDILLKKEINISSTTTFSELHDSLSQLGGEAIVEALQLLQEGEAQLISQDEKKVTFAPKLDKKLEVLDLALSVEEVDRCVRALNPWPGISVWTTEGKKLRILKARPLKLESSSKSDAVRLQRDTGVISLFAGSLVLVLKDGFLELLELQWEGKKPSSGAEFINGWKGKLTTQPMENKNVPFEIPLKK